MKVVVSDKLMDKLNKQLEFKPKSTMSEEDMINVFMGQTITDGIIVMPEK